MQKVQFGSWEIGYDDNKNAVRLLIQPDVTPDMPRSSDILFLLDATNITEVLEAWVSKELTPIIITGVFMKENEYHYSGDLYSDDQQMWSDYSLRDESLEKFLDGEPQEFEVVFPDADEQRRFFHEVFNFYATDWVLLESTVKDSV